MTITVMALPMKTVKAATKVAKEYDSHVWEKKFNLAYASHWAMVQVILVIEQAGQECWQELH